MDQDIFCEKIKAALHKAAVEGKISCAAARACAEELGVSYEILGKVANDIGVKICACQLGCF